MQTDDTDNVHRNAKEKSSLIALKYYPGNYPYFMEGKCRLREVK
jgi:hypothetical protein